MKKDRADRPFLEKFMLLPDDYEIFKFDGYNGRRCDGRSEGMGDCQEVYG